MPKFERKELIFECLICDNLFNERMAYLYSTPYDDTNDVQIITCPNCGERRMRVRIVK